MEEHISEKMEEVRLFNGDGVLSSGSAHVSGAKTEEYVRQLLKEPKVWMWLPILPKIPSGRLVIASTIALEAIESTFASLDIILKTSTDSNTRRIGSPCLLYQQTTPPQSLRCLLPS